MRRGLVCTKSFLIALCRPAQLSRKRNSYNKRTRTNQRLVLWKRSCTIWRLLLRIAKPTSTKCSNLGDGLDLLKRQCISRTRLRKIALHSLAQFRQWCEEHARKGRGKFKWVLKGKAVYDIRRLPDRPIRDVKYADAVNKMRVHTYLVRAGLSVLSLGMFNHPCYPTCRSEALKNRCR